MESHTHNFQSKFNGDIKTGFLRQRRANFICNMVTYIICTYQIFSFSLPSFFSSFIWAAVLLRSLAVAMLIHGWRTVSVSYVSLPAGLDGYTHSHTPTHTEAPLLPLKLLLFSTTAAMENLSGIVHRRCQTRKKIPSFEHPKIVLS